MRLCKRNHRGGRRSASSSRAPPAALRLAIQAHQHQTTRCNNGSTKRARPKAGERIRSERQTPPCPGRGRGTRPKSDRRATAHLRFAADAPRRERSQERYPATTLRDADRQRMPREEARRSPGESDEGAASRPQGQNAPCADDFAAASRAHRSSLRRLRQDCDPKPYLCTASGRMDAGIARNAQGARLRRNRPHADKAEAGRRWEGRLRKRQSRNRAAVNRLIVRGTSKTNRLPCGRGRPPCGPGGRVVSVARSRRGRSRAQVRTPRLPRCGPARRIAARRCR